MATRGRNIGEIINIMLPKNFYEDVEVPGALKRVLYSDTDSIYITIPTKKPILELKKEEKWQIVIEIANKINTAIIQYMQEYYLPKSNINPKHNMTDFKSELLASNMFFTGVKKNYAYTMECVEGVFLDPPKVKYVGIQVVKSNTSKHTQDMLKDMIENVMLNLAVTEKEKVLIQVVHKFEKQFREDVLLFNFQNIGIPGKWGKTIMFINGMKLYNFLLNEEVFNSGSSGKFMYCSFKNKNKFINNLDMEKTNGICVPYEYDIEKLKEIMKQYSIEVDVRTHWSKLFSTTCQRVVDVCKL